MQMYLSALALFILSLLPNFTQKVDVENYLRDTISPNNKTQAVALIEAPSTSSNFQAIATNANNAYFADFDSGFLYYEKNAQEKVPMASTTKLMTALTALLYLEPAKIITVGETHNQPLDTLMGLSQGDKVKVSELLHGLLIESGADAARTLSIAAKGDEASFVASMNENANRFGLLNTQFTNSVGYDELGHYSTASDLYKLTKLALENPLITEIVSKTSYTATSEGGKHYSLTNTNKLLTNTNIRGVKTGTTLLAHECLISLYDDGKQRIIGVILGSNNRFADTSAILDWTKTNFVW